MAIKHASLIALIILVAAGLYGAISLSYKTITGISPCPDIGGLPVCFIVTIGYGAMFIDLISIALSNTGSNRKKLFISGWLIIFLIAAIASTLELIVGNICPVGNMGVPLCYLSLAYSVVIMILYNLINKQVQANR